MIAAIKIKMEALKELSVNQLIEKSHTLVSNERKNTAALIAYLGELRDRPDFLEYGYNSVYKFCVEGLGLEPGQAYLRMQVSGVCKKFPIILEKLALGELSLSGAAKLCPVIKEENLSEILGKCVGKSVREIEEFVVTINQKRLCNSDVRKASNGKKNMINPLFPKATPHYSFIQN